MVTVLRHPYVATRRVFVQIRTCAHVEPEAGEGFGQAHLSQWEQSWYSLGAVMAAWLPPDPPCHLGRRLRQ